MNVAATFSCQCVDCPGDSCRCGCQADATPPSAPIAGQQVRLRLAVRV